MAERVNGVFAPISTPFIDEEIAYEHLEENINKYSQTSLSGLLVLGSNGESKSLTEDEKAILEAERDAQEQLTKLRADDYQLSYALDLIIGLTVLSGR